MGLKGIKSLSQAFDYITKDIEDFLKEEGFKIPKKAEKLVWSKVTGELKFFKELARNEGYIYNCFITGSEIVVDIHFIDNGQGCEGFKEVFTSESEFVEKFNKLIEWLATKVK